MPSGFIDRFHWCVANDRVVLLDLASNAYSALPDVADRAFRKQLQGLALDMDEARALEALMAGGVLVAVSHAQFLSAMPTARRSLIGWSRNTFDARPSFSAVIHQVWAGWLLKARPLDKLVTAIDARRARNGFQAQTLSPVIEAEINRFMASRRLVSRQVKCLRTSIALLAYLARHRYYPRLVIGVRMKPFAAHAWVQDGDLILNDTLDEVAPFTPILVA